MSEESGYERLVTTLSEEGARYAAERLSHLKDSLESPVTPQEILGILEDGELFRALNWMCIPLRSVSEGPESDPARNRATELLKSLELLLAQLETVKVATEKLVAKEVESALFDNTLELLAAGWLERTAQQTLGP